MHPILFRFGPITLYSYGLLLAMGFFAAVGLAEKRARQRGLDPGTIQNLCLVCLVAGILGARITYVLLFWESFRSDPLEILKLHHGGLVFYGGLVAGTIAGIWYMRRAKLLVLETVDLVIPSLVVGHAIGRIGCFMNGCCRGKPTTVPWAVAFPPEKIPCHPAQLYESAALVALLLFLLYLGRRRPTPGTISLTYGLLYSIWRFLIEFLRDNPVGPLGLTLFQWMSLPLGFVCGCALWSRRGTSVSHR